MTKLINFLACLLVTVLVSPNLLLAAMSSTNYQIWQDAISVGGGDDQSSSNYSLKDTLGEFGIGNSSSTNNGLKPGFRNGEFYSGQSVLTLSLTSNSVEFGDLSNTATASGSVNLSIITNSYTGVSITYTGSTLTCSLCSSNNTVGAIGPTAASSSIGSSQFGFNVIKSSGDSPYASSVSPYNSSGMYAFDSGDEIISSSGPINETVFNINFIANINGNEATGIYSTTITYTATANF